MSKVCPITGKRPITGHNVSHSQRHTKRRWEPNLVSVTFVDQFGRKRRQPIVMTLRPAVFDRDILALDIAGFLEALVEGSEGGPAGIDGG